MVYQSPAGARDLLPLDVAQKQWIEDRLQQVFHRWGYHRLITSTLERLDTLMAGGAIERSTVLQLHDAEDESLGLRPELTASIARAAATRMAGAAQPLRLYYNANVFRRAPEGSHSGQQEFYQAGVELLGGSGLVADAEIVLLLLDCLKHLGLNQCSLILGEAGLTRSLLASFPLAVRDQVRRAIAHLDRIALESLNLSPELQEQALLLFDLRGNPADVIQRVANLKLDAFQYRALDNLKSLVELLHDSGVAAEALPLILDLSLIRTFDYYTGIVFEVVSDSDSGRYVLGQGGRYDQLLALYHPQGHHTPGIGFSLQIEHLHQVLRSTKQLPQQTPASDWLVAPDRPQSYTAAFAYAQHLRDTAADLRVELALGDRTAAEVRSDAQHRQIAQIAWISSNGEVVIETVKQS